MKTKFLSLLLIGCICLMSFGAVPVYAATSGTCGDNLTWTLDDNGTLTISGTGAMSSYFSFSFIPWNSYRSAIKTIKITSGVTTITNYAFYNCDNLTSVTIPDSVTSIGYSAFLNCSSLASITLPDSVTTIGHSAFSDCNSLKKVSISDIEAWCKINFDANSSNPLLIAKNLYLNDELVTDLTIPDGVTSIGNYAFYGCESLTSVSIPDNVTSIGKYAFYGCTGLTSIVIPDNVTTIGNSVFCDCSNLTSVTIGDSVTSIENSMFFGCTGLTSITLSDNVTNIGDRAFSYCDSLTDVYYDGSKEDWNKISIGSYNEPLTYATIHYNCLSSTKTICETTDTGEKIFTCLPCCLPEVCKIILACYQNGVLADLQYAPNKNETVYFVVDEDFDTAKVMVWESLETAKPICNVEVVSGI